MNAKTLKALKGSIGKWENVVSGTIEDLGTENCSLCSLFHPQNTGKDQCVGCPVYMHTGYSYCVGTPYSRWAKLTGGGGRANTPSRIKAAEAELKFLKGLLP